MVLLYGVTNKTKGGTGPLYPMPVVADDMLTCDDSTPCNCI